MFYYMYPSLLTVKRAKQKAQATYQWDILIRVDQLTSCTRGGEGGRLTGHCGWGFGHSAARGVRRGRSGRGNRGLGVGRECCFWRIGGGDCAVGVWSCSSWSTLLGLYTDTVHITAIACFSLIQMQNNAKTEQSTDDNLLIIIKNPKWKFKKM